MAESVDIKRKAVTGEEKKYRKNKFPDIQKVVRTSLLCTACHIDVKKDVINGVTLVHPILDVLICQKCLDFYENGEFSIDEDGTDKYCRLCGQGGLMYQCSKCPHGFCKKCIKRNFPRSVVNKVEDNNDNWECFLCDIKPLYELRAICWAATEFATRRTNGAGEGSKKEKKTENNRVSSDEMYSCASQLLCEVLVRSEKIADLFKAKALEIRRYKAAPKYITSVESVDKVYEKISEMVKTIEYGLNNIQKQAEKAITEWKEEAKQNLKNDSSGMESSDEEANVSVKKKLKKKAADNGETSSNKSKKRARDVDESTSSSMSSDIDQTRTKKKKAKK